MAVLSTGYAMSMAVLEQIQRSTFHRVRVTESPGSSCSASRRDGPIAEREWGRPEAQRLLTTEREEARRWIEQAERAIAQAERAEDGRGGQHGGISDPSA